MSLVQRLDAIEAIMTQEVELISSGRVREVTELNPAKLEAVMALEIEMASLPLSAVSSIDQTRLERLQRQAGENANALRAMRDGLSAMFRRLSGADALAVGSYDPSGRQVLFERSTGRYEKKA